MLIEHPRRAAGPPALWQQQVDQHPAPHAGAEQHAKGLTFVPSASDLLPTGGAAPGPPVPAGTQEPGPSTGMKDDPVDMLRNQLLQHEYGQMPIHTLLEQAITTPDSGRVAMRLTLLLRKDETLPVIIDYLETSPSDTVRYELLRLIQAQLRWIEFAPVILTLLQDTASSDRVRGLAAALAALFQMHAALPEIRHLIVSTPNDQARQRAAMALSRLGNQNDQALLTPLLGEHSPYVRGTAAKALAQLGSNTGETAALELSWHDTFDVRILAAEALSQIGSPAARDRLEQLQISDPSPMVRSETAAALSRSTTETRARPAAIARLKELLTTETTVPPRWAFVYLAEHFGHDTRLFLTQLANSAGPLQHAATVALLQLDSDWVMMPYLRGTNPWFQQTGQH